jgi:nucleoside transporter
MDLSLRIRLSIMMLIQFFIWGTWNVTAPNYLTKIGFDGNDIGWLYAVGPIAGMLSPFFVGMIADRFFPAQRVLGTLHLAGAGLMFLATIAMSAENKPYIIIGLIFVYMLTYFPTLALTNTLALRNITNPETEFPGIRVMGTIGWIAAGLSLSWLDFETNINMFYLTTGAAAALGVYSFLFLPHTPPTATGEVSARQILGLDALAILKNPSYLVFLICSTLICIPLSFYYQITSRIVEMAELPIAQTMTFGQMSEIIFMLVMPLFFARLGVKKMLAVGMVAWVVRYSLFAVGAPSQISAFIVLGIILHGICYDFFFVTGQIYTDQAAPAHLRGQAQGLLVLFTLGLGMAIGAKVAGYVETKYTSQASIDAGKQVERITKQIADLESKGVKGEEIATLKSDLKNERLAQLKAMDWQKIWGIPAIFAAVILAIFMVAFKDPKNREPRPVIDVPTGEMP